MVASVWDMIAGLSQAWEILHHPALLVMPDGRTRLLWFRNENPSRLSRG